MPRFFADLSTEVTQAVAQTTAVGAVVLLLNTMLPEARPYAPFTLPLLILPLLYGSRLMHAVALVVLAALVAGSLAEPHITVLAACVVAYLSIRPTLQPTHFARLKSSFLFGELGRALPGWQAYPPRILGGDHYCRVLRSPAGRFYFVGVSAAREVQRDGQYTLLWRGVTDENIRGFSVSETVDVQSSVHVLWIVTPRVTAGQYVTSASQGVTTLYGGAGAVATQLVSWDSAVIPGAGQAHVPPPEGHQRPSAEAGPSSAAREPDADSVFAQEGRRVEAEARTALRDVLPAGWRLQSNVVLPRGGDADIVLTHPDGWTAVVDVKSRRDRMNLSAPQAGRTHSWQELHDQVWREAQQLGGVGVLWQPTANPDAPILVGQVHNVRGDARALLSLLHELHAAAQRTRQDQASVPRITVKPDHELLGVAKDASLEEIKGAWREKMKLYHPDKMSRLDDDFRALAEEKSKALNAAYDRMCKAARH